MGARQPAVTGERLPQSLHLQKFSFFCIFFSCCIVFFGIVFSFLYRFFFFESYFLVFVSFLFFQHMGRATGCTPRVHAQSAADNEHQ